MYTRTWVPVYLPIYLHLPTHVHRPVRACVDIYIHAYMFNYLSIQQIRMLVTVSKQCLRYTFEFRMSAVLLHVVDCDRSDFGRQLSAKGRHT